MIEDSERTCCCQGEGSVCTKVASQSADVSLPIQVKPYAVVGRVEVDCCEDPAIITRQPAGCSCSCDFVICQTITVKIPIEYGSTVNAGETSVCCKKPNTVACYR